MIKNAKKEYSKRVHEIFVEFGYGKGDTARLEYAIVVLINEMVVEAVMEERNGILKTMLDSIEDLKGEIEEQSAGHKDEDK